MSTIAAGTTTTTALVSTGNTDGTLQLQVNGTTPSVTLNALGAVGVGSTPGYGTVGQVLTSAGSTSAPTWSTVVTGTVFTVKTSNYTASASNNILADTSGGSFTITLPASPTTGATVYIQDAGYFDLYPLTVGRNGSTIMGAAEDMTVSVKNVGFGLVYSGSDWRIF